MKIKAVMGTHKMVSVILTCMMCSILMESSLVTSIESSSLTTKNIRRAGPYLSWYKGQEIIVFT